MSVQEPFRAIAILERTLRGYTLVECSREFDVSDSRCAQLANLGVQFLRSLPFVRNTKIPKHDYYDLRDRLKHQRFWLSQIAKARQHARVRVPERGGAPGVEHSVATALGRARGLKAREVISIVTEFEAALLAAAETPGRTSMPIKGQRSKSKSAVHTHTGNSDAHARDRNCGALHEISRAGKKIHGRSRRVGGSS